MSTAATVLELKSVSRTFGRGHASIRAVDSVSLTVTAGEIVLVMGPSGSGKTTLLSMAGGLLAADEGEVVVAGSPLAALGPAGRARVRLERVGFVFQSFNLLASLTARENVELVMNLAGQRGRTATAAAEALLERLGLGERSGHRPATLSGGEKQRVALARALANRPDLILADEPTGNLDSRSGRDVMMLLFDLAREEGKAVVVVSHDARITDIADRVLWLEDGRLSDRPREVDESVTDPVCGMQLKLKEIAFATTYRGRVYNFCSERCRVKFLKEPERYATR